MSIKIGDNNKIRKSNIIDNSNSRVNDRSGSESFASRHPIVTGIGCSIIASIVMMFAFWDNVSIFIKNLF